MPVVCQSPEHGEGPPTGPSDYTPPSKGADTNPTESESADEGSESPVSSECGDWPLVSDGTTLDGVAVIPLSAQLLAVWRAFSARQRAPLGPCIISNVKVYRQLTRVATVTFSPSGKWCIESRGQVATEGTVARAAPEARAAPDAEAGGVQLGERDAYGLLRAAGHTVPPAAQQIAHADTAGTAAVRFQSYSGLLEAALHVSLLCTPFAQPCSEVLAPTALAAVELRPAAVEEGAVVTLSVGGGAAADSAGVLRIEGLEFQPAPRLSPVAPNVHLRSTADTTVDESHRGQVRSAADALLRAVSVAVDNCPDPARLRVCHAMAEEGEVRSVLRAMEPFLPSQYTVCPRPGAAPLRLPHFAGRRLCAWDPAAAPTEGPGTGYDLVYATDIATACPTAFTHTLNEFCRAARDGGFVLLHQRQGINPSWVCPLLMCPARQVLQITYRESDEVPEGHVWLLRTAVRVFTRPPSARRPTARRTAAARARHLVNIPAMHTTHAMVGAPLLRAAAEERGVALSAGGAPETRGTEAAVRSLRRERPGASGLCASFDGAPTGLVACHQRKGSDPWVRAPCPAKIRPSKDTATGAVGAEFRLRLRLDATQCYVLHGALGSVGLQLASWLAARGARFLVFTACSPSAGSAVVEYYSAALRASGCSVTLSTRDASDWADCDRLLGELPAPLGGVFVVATESKPRPDTSARGWNTVVRANVGAAHNLNRMTCEAGCLFVCWSSADVAFGAAGRVGWAYSCGVLDGICEWRKKAGFPALSVQWGPVGDGQGTEAGCGLVTQSPRRCFALLETLLLSELDDPVVCCFAAHSLLRGHREGDGATGPIRITGRALSGFADADTPECPVSCVRGADLFAPANPADGDQGRCSVFAGGAAADRPAGAAEGVLPTRLESGGSAGCSELGSGCSELGSGRWTWSDTTAAACRLAVLALEAGRCDSAVVVGEDAARAVGYYLAARDAGISPAIDAQYPPSRHAREAVLLQRAIDHAETSTPDIPGTPSVGDCGPTIAEDRSEVELDADPPEAQADTGTCESMQEHHPTSAAPRAVTVPLPAEVDASEGDSEKGPAEGDCEKGPAEGDTDEKGAEGASADGQPDGPPPVRVSVRVRDALFREGTSVAVVVDGNHVGVDGQGRHKSMVEVDTVLYQQGQAEVYTAVGCPLAAAVRRGQHAVAIACGPSGTGKTFTMFGGPGESRGLLPRLMEDLFSDGGIRQLEIEVLCCYQDKVYDLLKESSIRVVRRRRRIASPPDLAAWPRKQRELYESRYSAMKRAARVHHQAAAAEGAQLAMRTAPLHLRRDADKGGSVAVGSQKVKVSSAAEAVARILAAADRRPQASTPVNAHSSRAHLLVNLAIERTHGLGVSRVQVVDMAGGERLELHAQKARRQEGLGINQSLLALKRSVAARREGWRYVPVRGSVLTRMLAWDGAHVEWVSTVAPGRCYAAQTRVTVQEAEAVRGLQRLRLEAAALAALRAAQERELEERRARQLVAAAAGAAAALTVSATGLIALQDAAERKAAAERLAPTVGGACAMCCVAAYHALWCQAVQTVKDAQRADKLWVEKYRAALPKQAGKKMLDPAKHSLATLLQVLEKAPPPERREPGEPEAAARGSDAESEGQCRLAARERKAQRARRQREKAAAALREEKMEVEELWRKKKQEEAVAHLGDEGKQGADDRGGPAGEAATAPRAEKEGAGWRAVGRRGTAAGKDEAQQSKGQRRKAG